MKITIITVTYNSAKTLKETLESVKNQTHQNIEHIIIDGNSSDNTLDIISQFPNISQIISEPDKGIYDAMRKGVALATGDIIGILNSDDLFENDDILRKISETFQKEKSIDAVYGNLTYFKNNNPEKITRFWKSIAYYETFFEDGYIMPHPTLFLKKSVYDQIGSYYPAFKISSDYELMLRAFKLNNYIPYYLNETLVKMRMGGDSTRNIWSNVVGNKEIYQAWKMNGLKIPFLFYPKRILFKIKQLINV
jgi:glycosyltransferase involved in cell wall biosynthesis